jgi:hypothetical protein
MCGFETSISEDNYGDHICLNCGVTISVYDPNTPKLEDSKPSTTYDDYIKDKETQPKEEGVINYKDEKYQGKFVYLPTMGETAVFEIEEILEVKSDNPKFNFSENVPVTLNGEQVIDDEGEAVFKKKDLGYHIEAKLKNGKILSVTSISAFIQVFKKHEIQDGDNVKIFHKDKGEWEVTKL